MKVISLIIRWLKVHINWLKLTITFSFKLINLLKWEIEKTLLIITVNKFNK